MRRQKNCAELRHNCAAARLLLERVDLAAHRVELELGHRGAELAVHLGDHLQVVLALLDVGLALPQELDLLGERRHLRGRMARQNNCAELRGRIAQNCAAELRTSILSWTISCASCTPLAVI